VSGGTTLVDNCNDLCRVPGHHIKDDIHRRRTKWQVNAGFYETLLILARLEKTSMHVYDVKYRNKKQGVSIIYQVRLIQYHAKVKI